VGAATRSKRNACSAQRDQWSHVANSRLEDLKKKFAGRRSPSTAPTALQVSRRWSQLPSYSPKAGPPARASPARAVDSVIADVAAGPYCDEGGPPRCVRRRFVRTARTECLDWLLIVGPRYLDRVLRVYVDHYNTERPHRALGRCPPVATHRPPQARTPAELQRRDQLGGLLHAYHLAAA
jgi:hypothetical protein